MNVKNRIIRPALEKLGIPWFSSLALENIDLQLSAILQSVDGGFFIEAGANDGLMQSNTYYLERIKGWRGLLVEPLPDKFRECKVNRPQCIVENCALVSHEFQGDTVQIENANLMSVVNDGTLAQEYVQEHASRGRNVQQVSGSETIETPAKTLSDLCTQHQIAHVDFFSLDVEGYEEEVLKGLDFDRVSIDRLMIETRAENRESIRKLLGSKGYGVERVWASYSYCNELFAHQRLNVPCIGQSLGAFL